jgi:excisionase family DNA binding protein
MNEIDVRLDLPIRLLKATEIAEILNISRAFAYRLMKQGVIPVVHIGNARRVRLGDLESFIELNISAPTIKD